MLTDKVIVNSLQEMLQCCNALTESLKLDQEYFKKNEMTKLHASNDIKAQHIERLVHVASDLKSGQPTNHKDNFLTALEKYSADQNSPEKREINTLVRDINVAMKKCYDVILTNSQVINANLTKLKNIWEGLLASRLENNSVYNHKGCTGK